MNECTRNVCVSQNQIDELFKRTNEHANRLTVIEVKMNMILWGVGVVALLVIGQIFTSIVQSKERVDRLYHQSIPGERSS